MAVLLTIVLTFFGAAACYRRRLHMNVSFFVAMLPPHLRRIANLIAELLVALFALFMAVWGTKLVDATWYNTIADFPALSVGVTYLPIPLGGAILLLFVIEHVIGGQMTDDGGRMAEQRSLKDKPSVIRPPSSVI
jgi:TRAP-type C4-dicarboxylate transport system permease small subunit